MRESFVNNSPKWASNNGRVGTFGLCSRGGLSTSKGLCSRIGLSTSNGLCSRIGLSVSCGGKTFRDMLTASRRVE